MNKTQDLVKHFFTTVNTIKPTADTNTKLSSYLNAILITQKLALLQPDESKDMRINDTDLENLAKNLDSIKQYCDGINESIATQEHKTRATRIKQLSKAAQYNINERKHTTPDKIRHTLNPDEKKSYIEDFNATAKTIESKPIASPESRLEDYTALATIAYTLATFAKKITDKEREKIKTTLNQATKNIEAYTGQSYDKTRKITGGQRRAEQVQTLIEYAQKQYDTKAHPLTPQP